MTNVFVRDLDLGEFNGLDGRRLEVIADGLTLWRGAQLAIDTTLVSLAIRRAVAHDGAALEAARRRKERVYPELSGDGGRARLVVLAAVVGDGGPTRQQGSCAHWPRHGRRQCPSSCSAGPKLLGSDVGVPCWRAVQQGRSPYSSSNSDLRWRTGTVPSVQEVLRDDRFCVSGLISGEDLPLLSLEKKSFAVSLVFPLRFFEGIRSDGDDDDTLLRSGEQSDTWVQDWFPFGET